MSHTKFHFKSLGIFCLIIGLINSFDSIAQVQPFRKNEIINAGNGMKVEVLGCRGSGESEECDVIYYTDKRQLGKRMWEKSSKLKEMKAAARMNSYTSKIPTPTKSAAVVKKPAIKSATEQKGKEQPKISSNKPLVAKDTASKNNVSTTAKSLIAGKPAIVKSTPVKDSAVINNPIQVTGANKVKVELNSQPMKYTLSNIYNMAKERNLAMKQAQNNIHSFEIDRKIAKGNYLPSVSYNIGHYISVGKNIDPVTNTFSYESFSGGYTAVGLQLDLFSGFSRLNTIKQTEYSIKAAEFAKKKAELDLLTNITLTYARLLLDKEQLAVERSIIASTTKEIEVINEKIKVGRLSKYEFYTFNARLNTQLANLVTLQNDSLAAVHELKQLLNVPQSEVIEIVPIDTLVLSDINSITVSASDYLEPILKNHPAIKQAEMEKEVARMREKISKSNYYPSLSLGGNVSSNYNANQVTITGSKVPLSDQLNDNIGQNLNINLRVPIFSQNENANRVKKDRINISNAELNQQTAVNLITSNTLQLINDFNGARKKYVATKEAWEQNKLSYDLHVEKYRVGQISSVELLTAQDTYNAATSRYIQTRLQLFFQHQLLQLLKSYN